MKKTVFAALAALLTLGTGCSRNDDGTTELMSAEEVAEKTQAAAVKTTEKVAEVTARAEEVSKQASAAAAAITVKAEDVMGDLNQSVEEIKQKVAGLDKAQTLGYVQQYKDVILAKKDQVAGLAEKLKGLSVMEIAGAKGKELKSRLDQYKTQLSGLKERYAHYYNKLEEFGHKMSEFDLSSSAE
jgi:uncharacterized coiled-coil DUF342 family protein